MPLKTAEGLDFDEVEFRNLYGTLCTADIRANTGGKAIKSHGQVITGHEGICQVTSIGVGVTNLRMGDICVLKPHIWRSGKQPQDFCDEEMMGRGMTDHMGFEIDGPFGDFGRLNAKQLVKIPDDCLAMAKTALAESKLQQIWPIPAEALFSITEPVACVLTGIEVLTEDLKLFFGDKGSETESQQVQIVGAGPIGIIFGLILTRKGWRVSFKDIAPERERAATEIIGLGTTSAPDTDHKTENQYDAVIVCTNFHSAVIEAERSVKNNGAIYLMAGFNTADFEAKTSNQIASLESIHRLSEPALMRIVGDTETKVVLYTGHSGYRDNQKYPFFTEAMEIIAAEACAFDRLFTGLADGLECKKFVGRHGEAETPDYDASTYGVSALEIALCGGLGTDPQWRDWFKNHLKLLVKINNIN